MKLLNDRETDRAMTPDAVVEEILQGAKDRAWLLRMAPPHCRWKGPRTVPPLFSEKRTRAWWNGGSHESQI